MKNYFHGGIVMNGFLKHPYFAGTFRNGRNSSQAQKDFVGPGRGAFFLASSAMAVQLDVMSM